MYIYVQYYKILKKFRKTKNMITWAIFCKVINYKNE